MSSLLWDLLIVLSLTYIQIFNFIHVRGPPEHVDTWRKFGIRFHSHTTRHDDKRGLFNVGIKKPPVRAPRTPKPFPTDSIKSKRKRSLRILGAGLCDNQPVVKTLAMELLHRRM